MIAKTGSSCTTKTMLIICQIKSHVALDYNEQDVKKIRFVNIDWVEEESKSNHTYNILINSFELTSDASCNNRLAKPTTTLGSHWINTSQWNWEIELHTHALTSTAVYLNVRHDVPLADTMTYNPVGVVLMFTISESDAWCQNCFGMCILLQRVCCPESKALLLK